MYPVMRNPRGSLMRKCDSDKHALAVGRVYHFYVDETASTNGDGTELNPWNSINNAFNEEIYNLCQQPCTKVYVHISGSIQHGIGYSVDRPIHLIQDYKLNLVLLPWKQDRVAVNPGLNYLSPERINYQVATYCRGVEYRNFDFIQQAQTAESYIYMVCIYGHCNLLDCTINMYIDGNTAESYINMVCIYGHCNLYDCTINMFIDGNAVRTTTDSIIDATPLRSANIVINSTINVYADYENSDTNKGRTLYIGSCNINSTIDTTYNYTITGNYKTVSGSCIMCYDKIIGVTIEVNIDIDNSIYSYGYVEFVLAAVRHYTPLTSIKNSNFSVTTKNYYGFILDGVKGAVQMHSSNIYISAISTRGSNSHDPYRVQGFFGFGELVDCSITATASANTVNDSAFRALGIYKYYSDSYPLLIDSCIISASGAVATGPPTGTSDFVVYQLQCALFAPFNSLNTVFIIDSDLSSGSCWYREYNAATGTITDNPKACSSENFYPASCMLGNSP